MHSNLYTFKFIRKQLIKKYTILSLNVTLSIKFSFFNHNLDKK